MSNQANSDAAGRILQVLNQLTRELMACDAPEGGFPRILSAAMQLLPVSVCLLLRRDDAHPANTLRLEDVRGALGRGSLPRHFPIMGSISQEVLDSRHWQAVSDLTPSEAWEADLARSRGLAALLCVPVIGGADTAVGVLQGYTDTPHVFSPLQVQSAEALALVIANLWQRVDLQAAIRRLKGELKTRKRVDRAKEILMDRRNLTAEDAYRWIQKRSMDTRRSMRDVAEAVILAEVSGHYSSIPHALDFRTKPPRR